MNVVYVSFADPTGPTGQGAYARGIFRHLLERVSGNAGAIWPDPSHPDVIADLREHPRFHEFPLPIKSGRSAWWHVKAQAELWRRLKEARSRLDPDLIVSTFKASTVLPGEFAAKHDLPYVLVVEGMTSRNIRVLTPVPGADRLVDAFARRSVQNATRIFVAYGAVGTWLMGLDPSAKNRIESFAGGIDGRAFQPKDRLPARKALGLGHEEDDLVLGFVGSFRTYHSLAPLLKALAVVKDEMPALKLLLVGDGPEAARVRELIKEQGLAQRVLLTGYVQPRSVPTYVAACDIMYSVITPEHWGNPLKCYEALACGRPVMIRRSPDLAFVPERGFGLVVEDDSVRSISAALIRIPDFLSIWPERAAEARALIVSRHDWRSLADRIIDVARPRLEWELKLGGHGSGRLPRA